MYPRRVTILAVLTASSSWAQSPKDNDLSQVSLEDLMNVHVTSVSKKEQKLSKAGAAIFVITQDDIRRSGATNIPDLLRLAPGVDVARVDANRWAISIRGFSDQYANKVLVLIDGRSVYRPSFSGVFWDMVDVPLEDIERIEVIRGPGGTVWGANAVNGVINIITKSSTATPGGLIVGRNRLRRPRGRPGSVWRQDRPDGRLPRLRQVLRHGQLCVSRWPTGCRRMAGQVMAGFRSDWNLSQRDTLTVQGDFLKTDESQTITTLFSDALPLAKTFNDPVTATAGNVLARWNHTLANGSSMSLQMYDDYSRHLDLGFVDSQNTVDLDFQHHIALGSRNDVVWGMGARVTDSEYGAGYALSILPTAPIRRLVQRLPAGRTEAHRFPVADHGLEGRAQRLYRI